MSHHSLSMGEKRILVILIAASIFCAATVLSSHGAVSAPLPPAADPQSQFQSDALMAQDSEWRRIEIGKIRYQKRMQHRADVLAGLHAEFEKRQAAIVLPPRRSPLEEDETASVVTSGTIWGTLAIIALLVFRHYWVRAARKEKPQSLAPVRTVAPGHSLKPGNTRILAKPAPAPKAPARRGLDLDVIDLDQQLKGMR